MALGPSVCLHVRDIIVSLLVVLKSPFVDVEDLDRVVGAGTGKLDPGALFLLLLLLLFLPLSLTRSVLLVLSPCSPGPGPPAEPLHCQRVALSGKVCEMKEKQDKIQTNTTTCYKYFSTAPSPIVYSKICNTM